MSYPQTFTDQLSRQIFLAKPPQRIISLVPSQTELLFDLGLADKIVGVTKFCVHPANLVSDKVNIGGTKKFNLNIIRELKPDLIIGNKEENYLEGIQALEQDYPIWISDIITLSDALNMVENFGQLTETTEAAKKIIHNVSSGFASFEALTPIPAAYFIWKNPYMSVGQHTFIDQMMAVAGFYNVFGSLYRYPIITTNDLSTAAPKVVFLSSEPYPFKEKHIREIQKILPGAIVRLVDGELFSWYGSRLQQTPAYLKQLRKETEVAIPTG